MGVKCLAQEHNTMSLARAQTQAARSGVECTNYEATMHPKFKLTEFELLGRDCIYGSMPSVLWEKW